MNKKIEYSYILHILIIVAILFVLKNYMNFDLIQKYYDVIEESKQVVLTDLDITVEKIRENPEVYGMSEFEISEYKIYNVELFEKAYYYVYYFSPAIFLLIVLGIVLFENLIFRRLKLAYMCASYDAKKDQKKERLKTIIREKLDYKYRRIFMPRHVAIMCMFLYVISILNLELNSVLERTIENLLFTLIVMLTIFGIRVAIKFFKTKSEITRFIVVMANIILGFFVPQMYFLIGFFKSLLSIKIIIKTS